MARISGGAPNADVHGSSRDADITPFHRLSKLEIGDKIELHSASAADFRSVMQLVDAVRPDETIQSIVNGTLNILEAIRSVGAPIRLYDSGSSESFGNAGEQPANERTAFRPRSPYGIAKAAAVSLIATYRDGYGLFACSGLLFDHESPLRPERFVTRKITATAVRISQGSGQRLKLATDQSAATGAGRRIMSRRCGPCCRGTIRPIS